MLDIKVIRDNPLLIQEICNERGLNVDVSSLLAINNQRLKLLSELEELRNQSNKLSSLINEATPKERENLIKESSGIKKNLKTLNQSYSSVNISYHEQLMRIPNLYDEDTPQGKDDSSNVELDIFGTKPRFEFDAHDHISLGTMLGMDFDAGARVAGSGFPLMKGKMALLEDAVIKYAFDRALKVGFTPVNVPLLAKSEILEGLGFNPRRDDQGTEIFSTAQDNLCLAGTAEIALVGQFADQIIEANELPLKLVAKTPCFRREGAYGRRDAGLYRNKMFNKVELVIISDEKRSHELLEEIREFEINLFRDLDIYFRVVRICAGDLGAPAFKKYDIEAWMMGRGDNGNLAGWGELTSCSNCTNYQARRLNIRYKLENQKPKFVHTLNGTGITSRVMIPILEQYQNADSTITIPDVLRPYMGGKQIL